MRSTAGHRVQHRRHLRLWKRSACGMTVHMGSTTGASVRSGRRMLLLHRLLLHLLLLHVLLVLLLLLYLLLHECLLLLLLCLLLCLLVSWCWSLHVGTVCRCCRCKIVRPRCWMRLGMRGIHLLAFVGSRWRTDRSTSRRNTLRHFQIKQMGGDTEMSAEKRSGVELKGRSDETTCK